MKKTPKVAYFSSKPTLSNAPIDPSWILEGNPIARNNVLTFGSDGSARIIIWDCTAGKFNWYYAFDETAIILEGSVTLFGGTPNQRILQTGDVVFFPKGSHAHWHVETYVHKLAFCHKILPDILSTPIALLRNLRHPTAAADMS